MGSTKYEGYNWLQIQRQRQVLKKQEMIDAIRALQLIPSFKRQATSFKRQAASDKVLHRGAWIKFRAALRVGRD